MSCSRRSTEDEASNSGHGTPNQNPFVSFRRAVDAQISSILHDVLFKGVLGRDVDDQVESFDDLQQAWEKLARERKEEASRLYVLEDGREVNSKRTSPWGFKNSFSQTPARESEDAKDEGDELKNRWLGHDGKKIRRALHREDPSLHVETGTVPPSRQNPASNVGTIAAKIGALTPMRENIRENNTWLHQMQSNGYPNFKLPQETIDDPFTNLPSTVPWLLHNRYSPLHIPSTSFDGRQLRTYEFEDDSEETAWRLARDGKERYALDKHPFKEAFEDLITLQTQGRMIGHSMNYASSRNLSGHPMHWITRLIEAGSLGQAWSVWGNGTTRVGLWFFNNQSNYSVNATLHSRLAQMPHIPYQAYKMRRAWISPKPDPQLLQPQQVDIDLDTAIDQANRAADYSSTRLHWPQANVTHIYEDEFDMAQASASHFELALEGLKEVVPEKDSVIRHLIAAKIDELHDRSINISEYLTSKALGLSEAWWYRSESDDMFEQDNYWKRNFAAVPFLAMAYDDVGLVSGAIEALKRRTDSDTLNRVSVARQETFIDLHRLKKLTELARLTRDSSISHAFTDNSSPEDFDHVIGWANENINVLKSQFIEEGVWEELGQQWQPTESSDYRFKDVASLRADCFPADKGSVANLRSPGLLRSFSRTKLNDWQFSPLFSPESPSPQLSEAQYVHYITNLINQEYELDAACVTLSRACYPGCPKPRIYRDRNGPVWENCTNLFSDPTAWHEALHEFRQENYGVLPDPTGWPEKPTRPQEVQELSSFLDRMRRDGFFAELDKHFDVLEEELDCLVYGAGVCPLLSFQDRLMTNKEPSIKNVPSYARPTVSRNGWDAMEESLSGAISELERMISNPFHEMFHEDAPQQDAVKAKSDAPKNANNLFSALLSQTQIDDLQRTSASVNETAERLAGALCEKASVALDDLKEAVYDAADANPHIAQEVRELSSALDRLVSKAVTDPNLRRDLATELDRLGGAIGSSDHDQSSQGSARSTEIQGNSHGYKEVKEIIQQTLPDGRVERKETKRIFDPEGELMFDSTLHGDSVYEYHREALFPEPPQQLQDKKEAEPRELQLRREDAETRQPRERFRERQALQEYQDALRWLEEQEERDSTHAREEGSKGSDEEERARTERKKGWFWK